jgi:hypothetical protein
MNILSFDNDINNRRILRDPNQDNLYNLFQKNIMVTKNLLVYPYIIPREFEMRLDRISNDIYGSPDFVEELMILNDIISPYSVQEGQIIYFCNSDMLDTLYTTDDTEQNTETNRQILINSSQTNRNKQNLTNDASLPPTVKPQNLQQVKISKDNNIQIINSFE